MASRASAKTKTMLMMFLLSIAIFVIAALYIDTLNKNSLLKKQVLELEQNQVLLMVPDEQAEAIAQWLATNPQQTLALLEQAKSGEQTSVEIGPKLSQNSKSMRTNQESIGLQDTAVYSPLLQSKSAGNTVEAKASSNGPTPTQSKRDAVPKLAPEVVSEGKDNVKVISLPHGGIRVTTRENN